MAVERALAMDVGEVNFVVRAEAVGDPFLYEVVEGSISVVIKYLDAFVIMVLLVTVPVYCENVILIVRVWLS